MKLTRFAAAATAIALAATAAIAGPDPFPRGFNNLPDGHWVRGRGDAITMPAPFRDNAYFDDFLKYEATDWIITTTEAGAGSASEALSDADDGVLLLTNDAADDDNDFLQNSDGGGTPGAAEIFLLESGKEMYFETRIQVSDATQSDFFIGLGEADTTPLATDDFIGFWKDDGDALLDFHSESDGVQTSATGVHTVANATWVKIAFYYDGGTSVAVAVNDVVVSTVTATPSNEELAISFGLQNGEAVAKTMSLDYVYVWKER